MQSQIAGFTGPTELLRNMYSYVPDELSVYVVHQIVAHQIFSKRRKNKRFSSIKQYICDNFCRMIQPRKNAINQVKENLVYL